MLNVCYRNPQTIDVLSAVFIGNSGEIGTFKAIALKQFSVRPNGIIDSINSVVLILCSS